MIVLAILKIIGIVLLCAIALAVLLLLLILFVPIDYCVKVKGDGEEIDANGGVKWLFGAVGAKAWLEKKEVFYKIKVFGISVKKGKVGDKKEISEDETQDSGKKEVSEDEKQDSDKKEISGDKTKDSDKKINDGDKANTAKNIAYAINRDKAELKSDNCDEDSATKCVKNHTETESENEFPEETNQRIEVKIFEVEQERKREEEEQLKQAEDEKAKAEKEIKKAEKEEKKAKKTAKKAEKKQKFKDLLEKAKDIKSKAEKIKRALDTRTGQRAKALVKSELFRLLGHIKPTLIKGSLVIGMDDPAKTAEIYGAVSQITYLISDGKLVAEPDFDRKIIQPDAVVKGRIFLFHIAAAALKIILNKDVSRLWKEIRRITNG